MNSFLRQTIVFLTFLLISYSFIPTDSSLKPVVLDIGISSDTVLIGNRNIGSGSKIMTDQDALAIYTPAGSKLSSIELYFSNIQTLNSDSSRLFIKTQRSWSCAPLGNAHPLQNDQYTLGLTQNVAVKIGWNKYEIAPPLEMLTDTIYIWPDLIQQVQPRVVYASGNNSNIGTLTGTSCATAGSDISVLDYACELTFITPSTCDPFLLITDSDSICYAADTILARTLLQSTDSITYLSSDQVTLDTSFEIEQSAHLIVDMNGCRN